MSRRIARLKYLVASFLFAALFFIQSLTLTWTPRFAFQALILNLAIMLGIYAFRGFDNSTTYSLNSCIVSYISGTILGILFALIPIILFTPRLPRLTFGVTALVAALVFPLLSCMMMRYSIKHLPPRRYLVIGKEEELAPILEEVEKASMGKFEIYSYMNPTAASLTQAITFEETKPFDAILIGDPKLARDVDFTVNQAEQNGFALEYLPLLVESTLKRIPLEIIDIFRDYYDVAFTDIHVSQRKRVFDLMVSAIGLILSSPVILFLAIAIPIESGWPLIFKQKRIGLHMKPFVFKKFRSLTNVSEEDLNKLEDPNETIGVRETKIGKFIRRLRLDEIPQFINVFQGNMSIIGPRPEMENYHRKALEHIPYYAYRYRLKPGISGWAQINYPHTSTMEDYRRKTEYDLYYIKNQSFRLDLEIALKTVETMLGMRGSK